MSYTDTATHTYSVVDIETVMRRFSADLVMIAQSSQSITEVDALNYSYDIEALAKNDYLKSVDLTLFSGLAEVCATQYVVNTASGDLTMSRPGGVMWPRVPNPFLRIVLSYTNAYDAAARAAMRSKLRIGWIPTSADISHSTLSQIGGRDYASNSWGVQRKDYRA